MTGKFSHKGTKKIKATTTRCATSPFGTVQNFGLDPNLELRTLRLYGTPIAKFAHDFSNDLANLLRIDFLGFS